MTAMKEHSVSSPLTKKKVLIVEDDGEMCLLLNILLDETSLDLDHVKSLEKAVEYLQISQPSVIILDNKLPDGFGINLLTYVKKMYPQIKIIMISGYGAEVKDAAIESGADDFIEKPFTRKQLLQSLELSLS